MASEVPKLCAPLSEPLLSFTESFSFERFTKDYLSSSEGYVPTSAKIIGQEKGGSILFAWDEKINDGLVSTNVGLYQKNSSSFVTIYQHETAINIVAATINMEQTLLAFTEKSMNEDTLYDSFIAEIKPQSRVFTLNIAGPDFRKLQFLYPDAQHAKNTRHQQTSHLLIIVPRVIICLYKIKMQQIRNGAVMATQPDKERLLENFVWYQWDPQMQYLYHARLETSTTRAQISVSGKFALFLNCIKFVNGVQQLVFTFSLPLPYSENLYCSTTTYTKSPFALKLPVQELNIQILYRSDGYWCACVQHSRGLSSAGKADGTESRGCKVDYSVYILHNGHVLEGHVPLSPSSNEGLFIHFMLIGCFIVAYIPGVMLHLLNIGPRVDPSHHLMFGPENSLFLPKQPETVKDRYSQTYEDDKPQDVQLSSAISFSMLRADSCSVMNINSSVIFECTLNEAGFLKLFKICDDPEMMEDLLHLVIVGFANPGMAISMIEHICQTALQFSDHRLFTEFIVASSFANVYLTANCFVSRQLPMTMTPTYQGKIYKNRDGVKLAYLKLSPILNFVKQLLVQSNQSLCDASPEYLLNYSVNVDEPFDTMCYHTVINQNKYHRMELRTLSQSISERDLSPKTGNIKEQLSKGKRAHSKSYSSILQKFSSSLGRRHAVNQATVVQTIKDPREMLWFLDSDEDLLDETSSEASQLKDKMLTAVSGGMGFKLRDRSAVYNIVSQFYAELQKQSCKLLLTMWSALGFTVQNHPLSLMLCRQPTVEEKIFLELLEAYLLSHMDIGLHPPSGYQTLYSAMSFLCLERSVFFQLIHNKALTPTRRFVDMLLEDCEDDSETLCHIFNGLGYRLAEYAFERWRDSTVQTLQATSRGLDKSRRV